MNLLDAIEQAVGHEYFDDEQHHELSVAIQQMESDPEALPQQPHSNKIVTLP